MHYIATLPPGEKCGLARVDSPIPNFSAKAKSSRRNSSENLLARQAQIVQFVPGLAESWSNYYKSVRCRWSP